MLISNLEAKREGNSSKSILKIFKRKSEKTVFFLP